MHKKNSESNNEEQIQQLLIGYWKEILKLDDIGIDDDFFELGGSSLLSLEIYDRLHLHYGREFPLFDLSIVPTIRTLGRHVLEELDGLKTCGYRSLKKIHAGGAGEVPLFLVHGGDGNARVFMRLSKNLHPDIPVYAFQWPGWDGTRGVASLTDMAAFYVKELLKFRPKGLCRIGGYCIGGVIAMEMIRLLKHTDVEVLGPLMVWDTPNIKAASRYFKEPWYSATEHKQFRCMAEKFNESRCSTRNERHGYSVPDGYEGVYEVLHRRPWLYTTIRKAQLIVLGVIPIQLMLILRKTIPIKWRWRYCMVTAYFAQRQYVNKYKFDGDVIYFRSDCLLGRPLHLLGWWDDLFMGFGEFCEKEIQGYVVGGTHVGVLDETSGAAVVNEIYERER